MRIPPTINLYLAKSYALNMAMLILALMSIVFLFDMVELMRRANKYSDVPLSLVFQMGILKLPEIMQVLFPFAVLFSGFYTFWHMTRKSELIVIRAAGMSIWQMILPIISVALLFGLLQIMVINPIGAVLIGKFEQLEKRYLERDGQQIAFFKEGLWLKQPVHKESEAFSDVSYVIIHAEKLNQKEWRLSDISFFFFDNNNEFDSRIDAANAYLKKGAWDLNKVIIHKTGTTPYELDSYAIPTQLTARDIEDSFASLETMSFWDLPDHIRTVEKAGFDATKLRIHLHSMISQPLLFVSLIFLAASICIRPPRQTNSLTLISLGVTIGFVVFFASKFLLALGSSGQIPILLAAWSPALICFLLGLTLVINMEEN